jgi:hypothetical protein
LRCERLFAIVLRTGKLGWTFLRSSASSSSSQKYETDKDNSQKQEERSYKKRLTKKAGRKGPLKSGPKKKLQKTKKSPETLALYLKTPGAPSGRQSGDLQGLSTDQAADSESVTELLEEGNPFEAGVVSGVEAAEADESEVRTHEVPQDDVPSEYLDEVQRRYRRH